MPNLSGIFRVIGPRLIGTFFAGVATYIGVKTSGAVQIDPVQAAEVVMGIFTSYILTHRAASAKINKGDAATGRVATAENKASDQGSTVIISPPVK